MKEVDKIILEIIEKLKIINPYRIILFGSYAENTYNDDSDYEISKKIPIDLGLLPDGKPTKETALSFYKEAGKINNQIKAFLSK
ncbi:MAG: nucleotidyltransferase domain-containing protein [Spirochaetes bacterium]|nr:nucleotidyltransferase domain-containing protein [Spirochaetota bacterium]